MQTKDRDFKAQQLILFCVNGFHYWHKDGHYQFNPNWKLCPLPNWGDKTNSKRWITAPGAGDRNIVKPVQCGFMQQTAIALKIAPTSRKNALRDCKQPHPRQPLGKTPWSYNKHVSNLSPQQVTLMLVSLERHHRLWSALFLLNCQAGGGGRQKRKKFMCHCLCHDLQIAWGLCSSGLSIWRHSWAIKAHPQNILKQTVGVMNTLMLLIQYHK